MDKATQQKIQIQNTAYNVLCDDARAKISLAKLPLPIKG